MFACGTKQISISTLNMSLSGVKRTSLIGWPMSANDPKRTLRRSKRRQSRGGDKSSVVAGGRVRLIPPEGRADH